jgi:hypothetical protein
MGEIIVVAYLAGAYVACAFIAAAIIVILYQALITFVFDPLKTLIRDIFSKND